MIKRGDFLFRIYQERDEKKLIYPLKYDINHWCRLFSLHLRHLVETAISKLLSEALISQPCLECSRDRMTIARLATTYVIRLYELGVLGSDIPLALSARTWDMALDNYNTSEQVRKLHLIITSIVCQDNPESSFYSSLYQQINTKHGISFNDFRKNFRKISIDRFDRDYKNQLLKNMWVDIEANINRQYNGELEIEFLEKPERSSQLTPPIPLTMHCKEKRMLTINTYRRSKVKFVHHDVLDHIIAYHNLCTKGVFIRHSRLFEKLGWPFSETNMNREGELVASVSYGCRQYFWLRQFSPSEICDVDLSDFSSFLAVRLLKKPDPTDETRLATAHILAEIDKVRNSDDCSLFSHVLCNSILEAEELQRKAGMSLTYGKQGRLSGRFDPWDPLYLSFMLESIAIIAEGFRNSVAANSVSQWAESKMWDSYLDANGLIKCNIFIQDFNIPYKRSSEAATPISVSEFIDNNCFFTAAP